MSRRLWAALAVTVVVAGGGLGWWVSNSYSVTGTVDAADLARATVRLTDGEASDALVDLGAYFSTQLARSGRLVDQSSLRGVEVADPVVPGGTLRMVWESTLTPSTVTRVGYGRASARGDVVGATFELPTAAASEACALVEFPSHYRDSERHELWSCSRHSKRGESVVVVRDAQWRPVAHTSEAADRLGDLTVASRTASSWETGMWGPGMRYPLEFVGMDGAGGECAPVEPRYLEVEYPAHPGGPAVLVPSLGCRPAKLYSSGTAEVPVIGVSVGPARGGDPEWISTGARFTYVGAPGDEPVWVDLVVADARECRLPLRVFCGAGDTTALAEAMW